MEKEIRILPASEEDVPGLQSVWHKTWLSTYPNEEAGITVEDIEDLYKDAYSEERMEKRRRQIRNPESGTVFLVAKDGEKVVGLCKARTDEEKNQLGALYILPEYQGRGIGGRLWKAAKESFDPTKDTYVEVAEYNAKAIAFYKKLGFSDTGRRFHDEKFIMKSGAILPEMEMVLKAEK